VHARRPGVAPRAVGAVPRIAALSNEDSAIISRARAFPVLDFRPCTTPRCRSRIELTARGSAGTLGISTVLDRVVTGLARNSPRGLYRARYAARALSPVSSPAGRARTGLGILRIDARGTLLLARADASRPTRVGRAAVTTRRLSPNVPSLFQDVFEQPWCDARHVPIDEWPEVIRRFCRCDSAIRERVRDTLVRDVLRIFFSTRHRRRTQFETSVFAEPSDRSILRKPRVSPRTECLVRKNRLLGAGLLLILDYLHVNSLW